MQHTAGSTLARIQTLLVRRSALVALISTAIVFEAAARRHTLKVSER